MNENTTIFQCEKCRRYFVGVDVFSFLAISSPQWEAFKAAKCPQGVCDRGDCAEVAAKNAEVERRAVQGPAVPRPCRRVKSVLPDRLAHVAGRVGLAGDGRSSCPRDTEPMDESGVVFEHADRIKNSECGVRSAESKAEVSPTPDQEEFKASGKADSANAKMIEFFDHQIKYNLGKWFSRSLLKEICGNDYINNRIVDAREHYRPLGYWIQNAEVSPDGVQAKSSHYRILKGREPGAEGEA